MSTLNIAVIKLTVVERIYNNSEKYCEVTDLYDYMNGIDSRSNVARQIFDRMIEFYKE